MEGENNYFLFNISLKQLFPVRGKTYKDSLKMKSNINRSYKYSNYVHLMIYFCENKMVAL